MNIKNEVSSSMKHARRRILFYATEVAHFWDSMKPLFYKYMEKEAYCTVVFPMIEKMKEVGLGKRNVERMCAIMEEINQSGAKCYYQNEWNRCHERYDVCYTASDYIYIDPGVKKRCQCIVALQITAIYTHIYVGVSNFDQLFGTGHCKQIDYIVVSQFVADWVNKKIDFPQDKFLRFGYPRLDDLYKRLQEPVNIPSEWSKKLNGKKVFLVLGTKDYPYWLTSIKSGVIIYRPHPFQIEMDEEEGVLEKLRKLGNVIIDDRETYYDAFKIADAMISTVLCSLAINFLMTDKPVLLLDNKKFDVKRTQHVADYREEAWYKASYVAEEESDIERFAEMVNRGEDLLREEQRAYRKYMQQHFDGKVCERIIDYFDNNDHI